jgi:hypothetical protein
MLHQNNILSWDIGPQLPTEDDPESYLGWLVDDLSDPEGDQNKYGVIAYVENHSIYNSLMYSDWAATSAKAITKFHNLEQDPESNAPISRGGILQFTTFKNGILNPLEYIGLIENKTSWDISNQEPGFVANNWDEFLENAEPGQIWESLTHWDTTNFLFLSPKFDKSKSHLNWKDENADAYTIGGGAWGYADTDIMHHFYMECYLGSEKFPMKLVANKSYKDIRIRTRTAWDIPEQKVIANNFKEFKFLCKPGQVWKSSNINSSYVYLHLGNKFTFSKEYIWGNITGIITGNVAWMDDGMWVNPEKSIRCGISTRAWPLKLIYDNGEKLSFDTEFREINLDANSAISWNLPLDKIKFRTMLRDEDNSEETHLVGKINTVFDVLLKVFGKPTRVPEAEQTVEWTINIEDPEDEYNTIVATIYDWKIGKGYFGEDGLDLEEITEWNVGGKTHRAVELIEKIIDENSDNKLTWNIPQFTYSAKGYVYGKLWGGGAGSYKSKSLEGFDSKESLMIKAKEMLDDGSLDGGMGYEYLIGAILYIETTDEEIEDIDVEFIGDLTKEQRTFLWECYF